MLNLRWIRTEPEAARAGLAKVGTADMVDRILEADQQARDIRHQLEGLRAERNTLSKAVGQAGDDATRQPLVARVKTIKGELDRLGADLATGEDALRTLLLTVPNVPHESVPEGADESANVVVRQWGEERTFAFTPRPNWELGPALGIIDFDRGIKIAGSRAYVLRGLGARLQRALIAFMLDVHVTEHGYTEILPPYMVNETCLVGTGNLPKFRDTLFHIEGEDRWLIPTAEVPVTNLYRDEVLDGAALPISHAAYTPCFRNEQMSAGRDTRGIKRGYQFEKVELVKITTPERGVADFEQLLADAEAVLQRLGLCYRVVQMCTGDLSFVSCLKYDLELWAAGCGEWLEVSSCAYFGDFQARRANIRYRPEPKAKPQFVHTTNGSGVALPRLMIAVLENGQREDGSVELPDALAPYWPGDLIIPAP